MSLWICVACGLEFPESQTPPHLCLICRDERQFVPITGQAWTSAVVLELAGTRAALAEVEPDLFRLTVSPRIGIGHQGLLVRTPAGNLLWEPPGFTSPAAIATIARRGGVDAIAGSHPHLMGAAVSWSHAFNRAPVYVNKADAAWSMRPDPVIEHWERNVSPLPGVTLVQCGGHFPGSSVLHWAAGARGRGAVLTGDTIFIGPDNRTVSAMRSYPNLLPLPERAVRTILERLDTLDYDRLYGSFGQVVAEGAQQVVQRSLARYIYWLQGKSLDL